VCSALAAVSTLAFVLQVVQLTSTNRTFSLAILLRAARPRSNCTIYWLPASLVCRTRSDLQQHTCTTSKLSLLTCVNVKLTLHHHKAYAPRNASRTGLARHRLGRTQQHGRVENECCHSWPSLFSKRCILAYIYIYIYIATDSRRILHLHESHPGNSVHIGNTKTFYMQLHIRAGQRILNIPFDTGMAKTCFQKVFANRAPTARIFVWRNYHLAPLYSVRHSKS
jgi:hypothetical protein